MRPWLVLDSAGVLVVLVASSILTRFFRSLAPRMGFVDKPATRKLHRSPVPLLGGAAVFTSLALFGVVLLAGLKLGWLAASSSVALKRMVEASADIRFILVSAGATVCLMVGLVDDRCGLTPVFRLVIQTALAVTVVTLGLKPEYEFLPHPYLEVAAVLWLVGIMNAFNLIDGADGLAAGIALIACATLGFIMLLGKQPVASLLVAALAGAVAGFLIHNLHPARIFLGSSGSLLVGFLLGAAALTASDAGHIESPRLGRLVVPVLTVMVPVYDTLSVICIRLFTRSPILRADRNHIHHRLMRKGYSHRATVFVLWSVSALICGGSVVITLALPGQWIRVAALCVVVAAPLTMAELLPRRVYD